MPGKTIDYTAASLDGFIAGVGALAMGSSTCEWLRGHGDQVAAETGSPWPYTQPAWVFTTRRLPAVPGATLHFVQGDVRPVHAAMVDAAGGRDRWIVGGGDLAGQFLDAGLLDEIVVGIGSVILGRGQPLLPRRLTQPPLTLRSVRQVGPGLAELHYAVPRLTP